MFDLYIYIVFDGLQEGLTINLTREGILLPDLSDELKQGLTPKRLTRGGVHYNHPYVKKKPQMGRRTDDWLVLWTDVSLNHAFVKERPLWSL